ncbi:transformation/transcription domain-associated protein [Pelomyxa schiedti]|nr:transformation/transcription domain-associated protein [Pelomyxa schiedti]
MASTAEEMFVRQYMDATGDISKKLKLVVELRENLDIMHTLEYTNFLVYVFPVLYNELRGIEPQKADGPEHKLRNTILEIIKRLPCTDQLKTNVPHLMKLAMYLLEVESEDNVIICLHIIIELHKNFKMSMENELAEQVQAFLNFVHRLLGELPKTMERTFQEPPPPAGTLISALQSFKVLTEVPIMVVLLFQLYPRFVSTNINAFIPHIVNTLALKPPPNSEVTHHQAYTDFISAQVKTLSFLAFLTRGYIDQMRSYVDSITSSVIYLFRCCPHELTATRKELLIATRHILATEFRQNFLPHIDDLFDEKILIGTGRTCFELLRSLAYGMLADMVHNMRGELGFQQLSTVVAMYSRNIHDPTLSFSLQSMSAKLLLNLVEYISKCEADGKAGPRALIIRIFDVFTNKFSTLKTQIPKLLKEPPSDDQQNLDVIKECRMLLKTLVLGLKNIIWGITSCTQPAPNPATPTSPFAAQSSLGAYRVAQIEESKTYSTMLKSGIRSFIIFSRGHGASPAEEKEILDHFAVVLTMVDPRIFKDVFETHMPFLFDQILKNQAILTIPQTFLLQGGFQKISPIFADILLNFLMSKLKCLAEPEKLVSSVMVRLFKLVFGSLAQYPENDSVLQPHLQNLIQSCLKYSSEESLNYFALLRALFRVIGTKSDVFIKDIFPLLPGILESLNHLHQCCHNPTMRDLFVELSLTIPVKPSALAPFINQLIPPILSALNSNNDLVSQGLSTLDTLVDNLCGVLDNELGSYKEELLRAVKRHLRPTPYLHGQAALKILGKMGGRSRKIRRGNTFNIIPHENSEDCFYEECLSVMCTFEGYEQRLPLNLGRCIPFVKKFTLTSSYASDKHLLKNTFLFVRASILSLVSFKRDPSHFLSACSTTVKERVPPIAPTQVVIGGNVKTRQILENQESAFTTLLTCAFALSSFDWLKEEANTFIKGLCTHFAFLLCANCTHDRSSLTELDPLCFARAVVNTLALDNRSQAISGLSALSMLMDCLSLLCETKETASQLPLFEFLVQQLCSNCYHRDWSAKAGGCLGLSLLVSRLTPTWCHRHQIEVTQALLSVFQDLPVEVTPGTVEDAKKTLSDILKNILADPESAIKCDLGTLLKLLISSLANQCPTLRSIVQESLISISASPMLSAMVIEEYLKYVCDQPHPSQPYTLEAQTAFFSSMSFVLSQLPPPLVDTPTLRSNIQVAMSTLEDSVFLPSLTTSHTSLVKNLLEFSCAICIKMDTSNDMKQHLFSLLVKFLISANNTVASSVKELLSPLLSSKKLPWDLVQNCLRPVLSQARDIKLLTPHLLQGLLYLFEQTNAFTFAVGERFFEHLKQVTEVLCKTSATTATAANTPSLTCKDPDVKVSSLLLWFFPLLHSPSTSKLLEPLVLLVMQLELLFTPREASCLYYDPLTKFLSKHATLTIEFFLSHLSLVHFAKFFWIILSNSNSGPLRDELTKTPTKLLAVFAGKYSTQGNFVDVQLQAVELVRLLVKLLPDWLPKNRAVLDCLIELWKSPLHTARLANAHTLPLHQLRESKNLIKCFLNYCRAHNEEQDLLFHMVSVFQVRTTTDFTFLKDFYVEEVGKTYPIELKLALLQRFLQFYQDPSVTIEHKIQAIQMFISPLLSVTFSLNQPIDKQIIFSIIIEILHCDTTEMQGAGPGFFPPPPTQSQQQAVFNPVEESLSRELLQLATLLVKNMKTELQENRKELIKFAWYYLKSEDITTRQCAYILVCRFIEAFETPPKIILQVYVALLRCYQAEAKHLVREALDILTPTLPKRLQPDQYATSWIKWTKKIAVEETNALLQLTHILHLILRHPNIFYMAKSQFTPHFVNCLVRVGLLPQSPPENRKLAVDVVELTILWEKAKLGIIPSNAPIQVPGITAQDTNSIRDTSHDDGYPTSQPVIDMIVYFLVRMLLICNDSSGQPPMPGAQPQQTNSAPSQLPERILGLLKEATTLWPSAEVKPPIFEKLFSAIQPSEQPGQSQTVPQALLSVLGVINAVTETSQQITLFITTNLVGFSATLAPSFASENTKQVQLLAMIFKKIIKEYPPAVVQMQLPEMGLYKKLQEVIESSLGTHILNVLCFLKNISEEHELFIDNYIPSLVKYFTKAIKDFVSPSKEEVPPATEFLSTRPHVKKESTSILIDTFHLISLRISQFSEQRKVFYTALIQLIEKSTEPELLLEITKVISRWIMQTPDSRYPTQPPVVLTPKDKLSFVTKMARFDQVSCPELFSLYLDLVYHMHVDHAQLENNGFMMGLHSREPATRSKFFELHHQKLPTNVHQRLLYIVSSKDWEGVAHTYWIKQALDLILAVLHIESIQLDPLCAHLPVITKNRQSPAIGATITKEVTNLVTMECEFTNKMKNLLLSDLLTPLREMIHYDPDLSHHLWVILFPFAWRHFSPEQQCEFHAPLIKLLNQPYHQKQQQNRPNTIQTLLSGIYASPQPPPIPHPHLKYLSRTFNLWQVGIGYLEEYLQGNDKRFPSEETAERRAEFVASALVELADLYTSLGEMDYRYGLQMSSSNSEHARAAFLYEQFEQWSSAADAYFEAMKQLATGPVKLPTSPLDAIYEAGFVECTKRLNNWDLVASIAKEYLHQELLFDSLWRLGDWSTARDTITHIPDDDSSVTKRLFHCMDAVANSKFNDLSNLLLQSVSLILKKWQQYPADCLSAQLNLLHSMHQLVEIEEASNILTQLLPQSRAVEMKSKFVVWRDRLPNIWEDVLLWGDIISWHQFIFSQLATAFPAQVPQPSAFSLIAPQETARGLIQLSHASRKSGLLNTCRTTLSKLYSLPNIDPSDAYRKLREQIKCDIASGNSKRGVEIVNLLPDAYQASQKADLWCLKAECLSRIGCLDEAYETYSVSMAYDKGWFLWGKFCDKRFFAVRDNPALPQLVVCPVEDPIEWARFAISCYLQGIKQYNGNVQPYIARCLVLLGYDNQSHVLLEYFESLFSSVPLYPWVTWLPHLIHLFSVYPASSSLKNVLQKFVEYYPQTLFFALQCGGSQQGELCRKEMVHALMRAQPVTTSKQNAIVHEICHSLQPTSLESALVRMKSIFLQCSRQVLKDNVNTSVLQGITSQLEQIRLSLGDHPEVLKRFNSDFSESLNEQSLLQLMQVLSRWLDSVNFSSTTPGSPKSQDLCQHTDHLHNSSPLLCTMPLHDIEIPGQMLEDSGIGWTVMIERFYPEVHISAFEGNFVRMLGFLGSNGKVYWAQVQGPSTCYGMLGGSFSGDPQLDLSPTVYYQDYMACHLYRKLNLLLLKNRHTCRRNVFLNIPLIVPVSSSVRLFFCPQDSVSLWQVYVNWCLSSPPPEVSMDESALTPWPTYKPFLVHRNETKQNHFSQYNGLIPCDILSKYMSHCATSLDRLFEIKRKMINATAASAIVGYTCGIPPPTPERIILSQSSCPTMNMLHFPAYNQQGLACGCSGITPSSIMMRLTPSIQYLFNPLTGIPGPLTAGMISASIALSQSKYHLKSFLEVFLMDDPSFCTQPTHPEPAPVDKMDQDSTETTGDHKPSSSDMDQDSTHPSKDKLIQQNLSTTCTRLDFLYAHPGPPSCPLDTKILQESHTKVKEMIRLAVCPNNLALCDPVWFPWL